MSNKDRNAKIHDGDDNWQISQSNAIDDTCGCRQLLGFSDLAHGMHVLVV